MNETIASSELILNEDGSVFHLRLKPEQLAQKIILVGDPNRVAIVASHFDKVECQVDNREFRTITGRYKGKRLSVLSTGIGCDNIDIVVNELDALANIDLSKRAVKETHTTLELVRLGTCGGLQPTVPVGSFVCSLRSVGLDGVLNFYRDRDKVTDLGLREALIKHLGWKDLMCSANLYVSKQDSALADCLAQDDMARGITISANGFYGPQGRRIRLELMDPLQNEKFFSFSYNGMRILNYEMESSALSGIGSLLGHKTATVCLVLANRKIQEADASTYARSIDDLILTVLERI